MTEKTNSLLQEKYYYFKHKSGLDVYVIPKDFVTYYATLTAKYGSVDNVFRTENEREYTTVPNGIAHFLEHKMFENEDGTDSFVKYGKIGADANAFTSFLKTAYLFSCTDNFDKALEILIDTVTHPFFTEKTVAKEQGIIGEEIGMMNDTPGWRLMFNMLDGMYKEHSVKINIAGSAESISQITADLLYKCYNAFYNPSNMVLIVCGRVSADDVAKIVDKCMPNKCALKVESLYAKEAPEVVNDYVECTMDISQPLFAIGIKDTNISDNPKGRMAKAARISVMLETMFGPSSPIYNELYESGMMNGTLSADYEHNRSFSFIELTGEAVDPDAVIERINNYVEEIKVSGLDALLFERAKKVVYSQTLKNFDSTEEINSLFLANIIDDVDAFDMPEEIFSVTKEECDNLIRSMFKKEYRTISIIRAK